jgi:hypothetical protein
MIGRVALLVTFKKAKPKSQSLSRSHIRDLCAIKKTTYLGMPFTPQDLEEFPISFCSQVGETWVIVGPCTMTIWNKRKIPLDGREYRCAGTIILRNGIELRASFSITTTNYDFIIMDSLYIPVEGTWYRWDEIELPSVLNISKEEFTPHQWKTDKPLDYHVKAPYVIKDRLLKEK